MKIIFSENDLEPIITEYLKKNGFNSNDDVVVAVTENGVVAIINEK